MSSAIQPRAGLAPTAQGMSTVNLAARQRMLSQRLMLQVVLAWQGRSDMAGEAARTLETFRGSQAELIRTARALSGGDGERVRHAYFGPSGAARIVDAFILRAQEALDSAHAGQGQGSGPLDRLLQGADDVLQALNAATSAFDQVSTEKERTLLSELKGIVSDIQSVAREAKVVSFNAQVIAARAGTVGREFAVVATKLSGISSEVDALAKKGLSLATR